jgi:Cu/Ag efflux protein CusF
MTKYLPLLGAIAVLSQTLRLDAGEVTASAPVGSASRSGEMGHADGTIVDIDAVRNRITLKHGAIEGLGMPAMTMIFRVADPTMLMQVKVGDSVSFTVTRANNFFTVTQLARR